MINFDRSFFFDIKKTLKIKELSSILIKEIIAKDILSDFLIKDISSPYQPLNESIIFLEQNELLDLIQLDDCLIITQKLEIYEKIKKNKILIKDLGLCYKILTDIMFVHEDTTSYKDNFNIINNSFISSKSFIHKTAKIGNGCTIGKGVKIGKNSIIKNNVIIKNAIINDNVVISDGTIIGSTGFGFNYNKRGSTEIYPQIGIVYIDSNCHIGSCCTFDRGKIEATYIGKNSMIDNMVHIAHNVQILDNACIAAQTGISGSVKIGKNVTIGGQAGIAGHLTIGDNVIIAAKSGVTKNIKSNSVIAGFPATDIKTWKKNIIKERNDRYK